MNRIYIYSPLRVSFAGGGTDISPFPEKYGGAVLNVTIDRGILIKYINDEKDLEIASRDFLRSSITGSGGNIAEKKLLEIFNKSGINYGKIMINGDVPPGSGLGSSSALMNSITMLKYEILNKELNKYELAEESYNIESNHLGIILGRQDPYAVSLGGFKFMEFTDRGITCEKFAKNSFIDELEKSMFLVYTGKTRASSDALREQAEKSKKNDRNTISKLLSLKDISYSIRDSIKSQDFDRFSQLINTGWEIKKTLGSNVSNERIDNIIARARSLGATAARLLGGGSQGFVLIVSKPENLDYIEKGMTKHSKFVIRISFDYSGTRRISPF
ncbi:kinase [Picrophilus oshimae]|uniref:Mevalonate kinase n=1 Tax=Picrophilus torridus (strain ATCC 700027 / DSM 9790 / JCM 10055 / NBRC 100828 / KAW 2/3) TaxID=1122961 RepID=Q6KZB5_PICTO|nr:kinase [Picrophilus oshimae]AAT43937.1 mevalonate kinase [Picrophilus oshimae DSM 9789]